MEEMKKHPGDAPEKMSYEQLEQVANQLSMQARQLYEQLQKANLSNMFKRLDYLFKVMENKECFSSDFVVGCQEEIEEMMRIPEQDTQEAEQEAETKKKE